MAKSAIFFLCFFLVASAYCQESDDDEIDGGGDGDEMDYDDTDIAEHQIDKKPCKPHICPPPDWLICWCAKPCNQNNPKCKCVLAWLGYCKCKPYHPLCACSCFCNCWGKKK